MYWAGQSRSLRGSVGIAQSIISIFPEEWSSGRHGGAAAAAAEVASGALLRTLKCFDSKLRHGLHVIHLRVGYFLRPVYLG